MTDRTAQARDAYWNTHPHTGGTALDVDTLRFGVEWADANPKPTTITRAELGAAADEFTAAGTTGEWVSIEDMLIEALSALGIEVRDE